MDLSVFTSASPGLLVDTIGGQKAFAPNPLPPDLDVGPLFDQYGQSMAAIGKLNAKFVQLADPTLIIRPLQRQEALASSAMEGTYTTTDELALLEAGEEREVRAETREVYHYISALTYAVDEMQRIPISHRLVCETHRRLLSNLPVGRGGNKRPGEYKTTQNWIGGLTIERARFVPPPPREAQIAMDQLEAFINRPDVSDVPPLLEAAFVHYQFETIHPFADANGRVGRILVPLILLARGLIESAAFFLSPALEQRRDEYIDRMFAVSTSGDWTSWIRFFLECCERTCDTSVAVIDRLLYLQQVYRQRSIDNFQSTNMLKLMNSLFANPVISAPLVQKNLGVTHRSARQIIGKLETIDIVQKIEGIGMPEYYAAREILRITS